jgi:hypothetical protein
VEGYPPVCTVLPIAAWAGPFPASTRAQAVAALEAGQVLVLPQLAFAVAPGETDLLTPAAGDERRKNISFDPATGALGGTALEGEARGRMTGLMQRFGNQAASLLRDLCPDYAPALEQARTSFRPAEIAGRAQSPRHDDRRLHVDAFPTRPMHGRRILRLFCNIAADGAPRLWRVGEPFADFAAAFLPRVRAPWPGQSWAMAKLGLTKGVRSRYDALMLGLHDAGKLDDAYQANGRDHPLSLPAGSTWLCFTDQVLHAAMAGHGALEQTFHLPVAAMRLPEQSPLRVLESLAGRALA